MALFNGIGKKISVKGQNVVIKAKGIADISAMRGQISAEEKKIESYYQNLGKLYFEVAEEEPHLQLAGLVEMIKASREKIQDMQTAIAAIENVKTCPVCGAALENDMVFCEGCGTKIEKTETPGSQSNMKFCKSCGAQIPMVAAFCTKCGVRQE